MIATEAYGGSLSSEQVTASAIVTEIGPIECKKTSLTGTLSEPEPVSLSPSFSECKIAGVVVTVTTTGCKLVIHPGTETSAGHFAGTLDNSCSEGKSIVISFGTCEAKIEGQSALSSVPLTDESGSPEKLGMVFEVTGMAYNVTKDGAGCPFVGTGKRTNGKLTGQDRITNTSESTAVGVFALKEAVIPCETEENCTQGKAMKLPVTIKASAPTAKIEGGGITISCEETKLEYLIIGNLGSGNLAGQGKELKLNVKTCKTANVAACATAEAEAPFIPTMSFTAFIGTLIDLRVVCGGEVNCKYFRAKEPWAFTAGAGATIVANNNLLEREKIGGEVGCVQEPKFTASFTVSTPNPFRLGKK